MISLSLLLLYRFMIVAILTYVRTFFFAAVLPVILDAVVGSDKQTREAWRLAAEHSHLADLYHAFHHVHTFTTDPFTDLQPEVLLQVIIFT